MWINRRLFDSLMTERHESAQDRAAAVEAARVLQAERASLIRENAAHLVMLDWSRVRINHLERQFAAVLYSKTNIELPIPKIESTPTQQTNPNMLPDFDHVSDDDPQFKAHPEWYTTGPEPFPLPGVTEK